MAIGTVVVCQRIYPVPWEWRRIGLAIGVTVALCLAALALDAWAPFYASLPLQAFALALAYPLVLVVVLGFFSAERPGRHARPTPPPQGEAPLRLSPS